MEITDIIKLAKLPESESIKLMREDSKLISMLYFGEGTDEYLAVINGYENLTQHKLRTDLSISMEFMIEELLRQSDSIWTAKGGNIETEFKGKSKEKFIASLKDVRGGMTLRQFMHQIWWERFVVDPNGLIFVEVDKKGGNFELTYKSIFNIKSYLIDGITPIWVLFEPFKKESIFGEDKIEKVVEYQWFVDSDKYVLLKKIDGEYTIEKEKSHNFGTVPAVVNSSIFSTKEAKKISPIHKQRDLLTSYLVKNSVKEIHQFLHLYPIFWQYEQICPVCRGKRKVDNQVCTVCNGTGLTTRKDVSDVISLKKPDADETAIGAPAGYISPDIATMGEQRTELEWLYNILFHSMWGTTTEKSGGEKETATGRFIDIQPVNNKLNMLSDIAQTVETKLMNLIGKFLFPESSKNSTSLYGRRFIIETPDMLMERYLMAKGKLAPVQMLTWLLEQFYIAEFANDENMAEFYLKLMLVEPFVHNTIEQVSAMPIADGEKLIKIYFQEWVKEIDPTDVITKTREVLIAELVKYSQTKKLENGKTEEPA